MLTTEKHTIPDKAVVPGLHVLGGAASRQSTTGRLELLAAIWARQTGRPIVVAPNLTTR
jgi:hypothetical protein